ncbi:hypothetical protein Tco_0560953 [Tanacetum coccineum]
MVKLAHRCIAMTITGIKESTHRVTEIDLFYLYCIYSDEVVCNIPYWLAKLLTNEMMGDLSVEPFPHAVEEDDEGDEAVGGDASHEGAGGSADMYRNMSQGFYAMLSSDLTNKIACRKFLIKNEEEIFTDAGDGVWIYPDGVTSPAM